MNYEERIEIMQDNLRDIRKLLDLSAPELGYKIGVRRQTINNIEAKRTKLSKTQYLAIMYVLEHEIIPKMSEVDKDVLYILLTHRMITKEEFVDLFKD